MNQVKILNVEHVKTWAGKPAKRLGVFSLLKSLRTTLDRQSIVSLINTLSDDGNIAEAPTAHISQSEAEA
jgi:hypothetical protein